VQVCRAHGTRVIPQFNCLGHQSWRHTLYPLLTEYRELEEPPDDAPDQRWTGGRSWCPLHPQVNEIVFALMDELIEAFDADAFHVGMDEVLVIAGRKCPRCRDRTPAEVFARAVNDYHRHLVEEKKLTMLMWGARRDATERMLGHLATTWVLEPGGFARALLGEQDSLLVSPRARDAAAACRAALAEPLR